MPRRLDELEGLWREALASEDTALVEQLVREILREHAVSVLASEIHYQRGTLTLTEGEGVGSERLARALSEFQAGATVGRQIGETAEPWRSLNRTQVGACLGRLGNLKDAKMELEAVAEYRPRSVMGLGALSLLVQLLREEKPVEARRYKNQRLSYARALVRESKDSPEIHYFRFLLAQELLMSEYAEEGKHLMQELFSFGPDALGQELFEKVQESMV